MVIRNLDVDRQRVEMQVHGMKEATLAFTALGASVSRWTLMNDNSKSEPHFSPMLLLAWNLDGQSSQFQARCGVCANLGGFPEWIGEKD